MVGPVIFLVGVGNIGKELISFSVFPAANRENRSRRHMSKRIGSALLVALVVLGLAAAVSASVSNLFETHFEVLWHDGDLFTEPMYGRDGEHRCIALRRYFISPQAEVVCWSEASQRWERFYQRATLDPGISPAMSFAVFSDHELLIINPHGNEVNLLARLPGTSNWETVGRFPGSFVWGRRVETTDGPRGVVWFETIDWEHQNVVLYDPVNRSVTGPITPTVAIRDLTYVNGHWRVVSTNDIAQAQQTTLVEVLGLRKQQVQGLSASARSAMEQAVTVPHWTGESLYIYDAQALTGTFELVAEIPAQSRQFQNVTLSADGSVVAWSELVDHGDPPPWDAEGSEGFMASESSDWDPFKLFPYGIDLPKIDRPDTEPTEYGLTRVPGTNVALMAFWGWRPEWDDDRQGVAAIDLKDQVLIAEHTFEEATGSWWRDHAVVTPDGRGVEMMWGEYTQDPDGSDVFFGTVNWLPTSVSLEPSDRTVQAGLPPFVIYTMEAMSGTTYLGQVEPITLAVTPTLTVVGNRVLATAVGTYTVTGSWAGYTNSARLTVGHGPAASIAIEPTFTTGQPDQLVTYSITASDAFRNVWDVTDQVTMTIDPRSGGNCTSNACYGVNIGTWWVRAYLDTLVNTAYLKVAPYQVWLPVVRRGDQ